MKKSKMKVFSILVIIMLFVSCTKKTAAETNQTTQFVIAFGSCNDQSRMNNLWDDILINKPDVWVWGGDNIYADTEDMQKMESDYEKLRNNVSYKNFSEKVEILGTWDDHDYGKNDAGVEYPQKDTSQQLFLDFLNVPSDNSRRTRKGIYHSKIYNIANRSIKVLILDTRYFRTALTEDPTGTKRYIPNAADEGTFLGNTQWEWLANELENSKADFNILVSSIQFLSQEHGWETWGNMPHEVIKMKELIVNSKAKRVLFLSGDRHISEISKAAVPNLNYPLFDFTSSGLTHTYEAFVSETNTHRVSKVITDKNYGVLTLDLTSNSVLMEIRGAGNLVLESINHQY